MTNLERYQEALHNAAPPAFLISDNASLQWISGFTGSYGFALVTPTDAVLVTDSRYTLQAEEQAAGFAVRSFANPTPVNDFLYEQIQTLGIERLGFDEHSVTVATHRAWAARFAGVELVAGTDAAGRLRMTKSVSEMDRIRAACRLADACVEHIAGRVAPGVTEVELLLEIESFLRRNGAAPAFPPIVVSGERSARPHGVPSDKPLEVGDFVTFDLGARLEGYCSDITRTFVIGEPSDRQREVYTQVLRAQEAAIAALLPGANGRDVDALSRQILDEIGLARYFGHGLGHGLGALVHDTGRLSPGADQPIEVGQVWTVEPGAYIPGFGGVRIEDDVLITEAGPEVLTLYSKELRAL